MSSSKVEEILSDIGAMAIGVAPYGVLEKERVFLDNWLQKGWNAELDYMQEYRREDPSIIFPQCRSVIVVLFGPQKWTYHSYIRRRLKRLLKILQLQGRGVVDSAPILERAWAVEAGLGWIGSNSMLIHPEFGSDFNIGVLLVDADYKQVEWLSSSGANVECKRCSECDNICVKTCPTQAINQNKTVNCNKCLSHISQREGWENIGCTICQKICPYNKGRFK